MADKVEIELKSTGSAGDKSVDKMGSKASFLSESYGPLKFRPSEMHMEATYGALALSCGLRVKRSTEGG